LREEALEHPFSNWVSRVLDGEYGRDFTTQRTITAG
jgi:hypothetical protein